MADGLIPADDPDAKAERQRLIEQALTTFRAALAAGFDNLDLARKDDDLRVLGDLPEFQTLLKQKPAAADE